jgi:hypothetical protein
VGWDGYLYPWTFSVHDFEPITGRIHQPPPLTPDVSGAELRDLQLLPEEAGLRPAGGADPVPPLASAIRRDDLAREAHGLRDLAADARRRLAPCPGCALLDDPRVISLWDGSRLAGNWFADRSLGVLGGPGNVVWDAYYAFAASAQWRSYRRSPTTRIEP